MESIGLDWDSIPAALSAVAAKPKGTRAPDEPTQQPMRPDRGIRQAPSTDQKKVRRAMQRKTATIKESTMSREAELLQAMAVANASEQRRIAVELAELRAQRTASVQADRDLDLASRVVTAHLTPVSTHIINTASTDWMGQVPTSPESDPTLAMKTEANLWFGRVSAEVRADRVEFAVQAQGMARRVAGKHGEQYAVAERAFLDQVGHLYRVASDAAKPGDSSQAESTVTDYDRDGDDDPFLSEDWPGGEPQGVHPDLPGAGGQSTATQRTANEDNFGGKKAPPFGSDGEPQDDDEDAKEASRRTALGLEPEDDEDEDDGGPTDDRPFGEEQPLIDWLERDRGDDAPDPDDFYEREGSRRTAADGQTCAVCGAAIERDPEGEENRTWHHADGASHDHEAKPASDSKESSLQVTAAARPLYEIADDIRRSWPNVYFGAVPYLDALGYLNSITDSFGEDDAKTVVAYLLSNMTYWRGPDAQRLKAELKAIQSGRAAAKTAGELVDPDDPSVGVSGLDDVEVGDKHDKPAFPWEMGETQGFVSGASKTADGNYTQCPNHADQSYDKSTGDCSCGSNHRKWADSNNPGGQKASSLDPTQVPDALQRAATFRATVQANLARQS